ncbi:MAG: hypothetical protein Q7U09_21300 [Hydrogenophaga sp.]|nr:hypothetical protein [Hydrogenophaga sp.]
MKKSLFIKTAVALALAAPLLASAESELVTGNATVGGADARLNFQIVIPAFISLRVGTAGVGNVDTVEFNLTDAQAAASGVYASVNPSVQVALLSNVGDVALSSLGSPLSDGVNTIPLSTIAVSSSNPGLPHPGFNTSTTINPSAGRIVNSTANWSFAYNHDATTVGDGTYTTQVTYTAARP